MLLYLKIIKSIQRGDLTNILRIIRRHRVKRFGDGGGELPKACQEMIRARDDTTPTRYTYDYWL